MRGGTEEKGGIGQFGGWVLRKGKRKVPIAKLQISWGRSSGLVGPDLFYMAGGGWEIDQKGQNLWRGGGGEAEGGICVANTEG